MLGYGGLIVGAAFLILSPLSKRLAHGADEVTSR
jgi:hypothetical protein